MGLIRRTAGLWLSLTLAGCSARPATKLPPVPLQGRWHTVRGGETLEQLARQYRVPLIDIEEINGLDRREPLAAGRRLFIPQDAFGADRTADPPTSAPTHRVAMRWPVRGGRVASRFGQRAGRPHEGIDIAAPAGTAVLAAAAGTVI